MELNQRMLEKVMRMMKLALFIMESIAAVQKLLNVSLQSVYAFYVEKNVVPSVILK